MCVCVSGEEARRVHDDAVKLLNRLIDSGGLKARGLLGFWHAQSDGDDIHLYADDVTSHVATFHGLRQQVRPVMQRPATAHSVFTCISVVMFSTFPPAGGKGLCELGSIPVPVGFRGSSWQRRAGLHRPVRSVRVRSRRAQSGV